jgi:hypothetical protein
MSAFLCSTNHLAAIAAWATCNNHAEDPVTLCVTLRRLNNAAMLARYKDPATPLDGLRAALQKAWAEGTRSPAEVLALLKCLQYQCAEGDVLEEHPDRHILQALIVAATAAAPSGAPAPHVWELG